MRPTIVHCLFEQSGTFKTAFRQLGIGAIDYDIRNDFGQTDIQCDILRQIDNAYNGMDSIFRNMSSDDLIMAFFPCIYFNEHNEMYFCGTSYNFRALSPAAKIRAIIDRSEKRQEYYRKVLQLIAICEDNRLKLVIENPYNAHHYWRFNFPNYPKVIDMDRTLRGDYFKKPTQFIFVGFNPGFGRSVCKSALRKYVQDCSTVEQSMMTLEYAHNFICDCILDEPSGNNVPTLF